MTSPPSTSASSGTRSGRGLRQKVVDELKSVRGRKSPATEKRSARVPPPLELSEEEDDEDDETSPDTPVNAQTKSKGCSICERSFTVFRAKHTCKMCAQKICDDCSKNRMKLHRRLERKKVFDEMSRPKGNKSSGKPQKIKQRQRRRSREASTCQQRGRTQSSLSDSNVTEKRRAVENSAPPSPNTSQEDELEVNTGDIEGSNEQDGFSLDKLVASLDEGIMVRAPDGELQLGKFMASCNDICGFLSVFGRATSFAGSTVGGYFTVIEHNLEAWSAPSSSNTWIEQSVIAVIEHEVELKVANVGGKKKPSCSRCLLRLLWFVEFVEACVRHTLLESTEDNCYAGASKAYEETLGKRHPWLVRKGVNTALGSIPTRSHILTELHLTDDNGLEPLRRAHKELAQIVKELGGVFEKHGLQDLK
ncbi:hypothetical protein BBJ29_006339 [Phytophthora kernoviae]|uniref:FYVE-type domain-containing protein n=1 Tax=Phytophthora kernoviae TaxID=325452 RepID=A0A3F2RLJ6_9STRA|nr:hypothetical protein BBP00_00006302 [Phytophthora kernoviae]RLN71125.1 hypothetical protein BBJ29_006339 [Phytophthora kernoviae]